MRFFYSKTSLCLVCATAAILVFLWPKAAPAHKPLLDDTGITRGKTAAGFSYMSGGFAHDDQRAMKRQAARYNLKLIFAPRLGSASAPVMLLIGDNQSHSVDKIVVQGPWLYVQLPSGLYTFMARVKNQVVLIRDVHLEETRRTIHFAYGAAKEELPKLRGGGANDE